MTAQIGLMAYIAVFIFTFFAGSFLIARCAHEPPTKSTNILLLVGVSLVWPLTLPLAVAAFLLFSIARLAEGLADM